MHNDRLELCAREFLPAILTPSMPESPETRDTYWNLQELTPNDYARLNFDETQIHVRSEIYHKNES